MKLIRELKKHKPLGVGVLIGVILMILLGFLFGKTIFRTETNYESTSELLGEVVKEIYHEKDINEFLENHTIKYTWFRLTKDENDFQDSLNQYVNRYDCEGYFDTKGYDVTFTATNNPMRFCRLEKAFTMSNTYLMYGDCDCWYASLK